MRVVLQRVTEASVKVDGAIVGQIQHGFMALVGIGQGDNESVVQWMADKTAQLRVFEDEAGKMNRSIIESGGAVLAISQFTLYGDCRKGRRPAFTDAAAPDVANELYQRYVAMVRQHGIEVETGIFAADMKVSLVNDGPVTILLERESDTN
ncbi:MULTISPECIES: D-aminoacyl-tRNA deacylase [Rhodopirellula]|uniref:D-aminoacyl-tRNA deacylase n=1 Tax=Rhodopirellula sp. MGV TaxID=2023130 RepID=UPI000B961DAE|nr:D-tyrosyl-tRNA(Tyr) deacylase [Rhodopirellula sp. MGV]PNY34765.1 D-tyrosyl-tRNA(Tyr) deacylase [Rhodopirellula baltica]